MRIFCENSGVDPDGSQNIRKPPFTCGSNHLQQLLSFINEYAIMTPPVAKLWWGTFMKRKIISYAILVLAVVFIIVGVTQSGYQDTLRRAAVVCLECVGIG